MLYFIHYSKVDSEPKREWLLVGRELCNVEEALNHLEKAGLPCKLHVD
jgi:hypothetical protein